MILVFAELVPSFRFHNLLKFRTIFFEGWLVSRSCTPIDRTYTSIGVMPGGYHFPQWTLSFWYLPFGLSPPAFNIRVWGHEQDSCKVFRKIFRRYRFWNQASPSAKECLKLLLPLIIQLSTKHTFPETPQPTLTVFIHSRQLMDTSFLNGNLWYSYFG